MLYRFLCFESLSGDYQHAWFSSLELEVGGLMCFVLLWSNRTFFFGGHHGNDALCNTKED
jgi:hypothetical protein